MKKRSALFFMASVIIFYSCEYKNYESIKPKNSKPAYVVPCDSSAVEISYSLHIAPILEFNCGSKNSCHNSTGNGGNIVLEDYNGVSYAAATGQLMSCVTWDGSTIFMPQNTNTKLDPCYIKELQRWVDAGFPNN